MTGTRLGYVDVFRGFALLAMVALHLINAVSVLDIYSDPPYYNSSLDMPFLLDPPILFTFVSGISVFFLTKKWLDGGERSAARKVLSRYGKYIAISFPFTSIFFGLSVYLKWGEAIQGIGLTAIFASLILLYLKPSSKALAGIIVLASAAEAILLDAIRAVPSLSAYPLTPTLDGGMQFLGIVAFNALIGGWFSVANLLPIALGGVLMQKLFMHRHTAVLYVGLAFTAAAFLLHFTAIPITYFGRSFSFSLFSVGLPMLVFYVLYILYEKLSFRFLSFMKILGKESLLVYLSHIILLVKPIEWWGLIGPFPNSVAVLASLPLVGLVYAWTYAYSKWKGKRATVPNEKTAI